MQSITAKELVEASTEPWQEAILGIDAKGPIISFDKLLRVIQSRDGEPLEEVWLYARRLEDDSVKYIL
jgi:hypothetical protein